MSQMMTDYQIASMKESMDGAFLELKEIIENNYKVGAEGKTFSKVDFDKAFLVLSDLQRLTTKYEIFLDNKESSTSWEEISSESLEANPDGTHANSDEEFCKDIETLEKQSDYEIKEFGQFRDLDITMPEGMNEKYDKIKIDPSNIPEGISPKDLGFVEIKTL